MEKKESASSHNAIQRTNNTTLEWTDVKPTKDGELDLQQEIAEPQIYGAMVC